MSDTKNILIDDNCLTGNDSVVMFCSKPSTSISEPFEIVSIPYNSIPC